MAIIIMSSCDFELPLYILIEKGEDIINVINHVDFGQRTDKVPSIRLFHYP